MDAYARRPPRVGIVGAGFGGLSLAIELIEAGHRDLTIFERAAGVGGVWRHNVYPGAACDVPSHLYSLSRELNPQWSRMFSGRDEILDYLERCVERYRLQPYLRFGTEVRRAAFDEDRGVWELTLGDGSAETFEVLVAATGQLRVPAYPSIPGREAFTGSQFHSAEWDDTAPLDGKRVAVVGTGASAIQFVPEIVDRVGKLLVFQRSAPWVVPKPDRAFTAEEKSRFARLPWLMWLYRQSIFWRFESRFMWFRWPKLGQSIEKMVRKFIAAQVPDPDLAARLTPDYPLGCKRILISNDWYPALTRPNSQVVTEPIVRLTPTGVVTGDGTEHAVDTVIYGTGFKANDFLAPMAVIGRDGRDLNEQWRNGAEAYLGMSVAGFPNLFLVYGPNTNLGHNSIIYMIEAQVGYIRQAIELIASPGIAWLDVRDDVSSAYNARVQEDLTHTVWAAGCTSWYKTADGRNTNNWPTLASTFRRRTRRLDATDYLVSRPVPTRV